MRILMCSHPEVDYLAYFLSKGLREVLGAGNVIDFPYKHVYHGESVRYPIPWYGEDKMGHSAPPTFFKSFPQEKYDEDEVVMMLKGGEFDLVCLESIRSVSMGALKRLSERCPDLPPVVMVDGEDYNVFPAPHVEEFFKNADIEFKVVFKREMDVGMSGVYPLPFSSYVVGDERWDYDDSDKKLDLFFVAGDTFPTRRMVSLELGKIAKKHNLKAMVGLGKYTEEMSLKNLGTPWFDFAHRVPHRHYLRNIAQSKIAVAVRGFGRDTIRFWESLSYRTLVLSDDLYNGWKLQHPHPFTHGRNIVFFDPEGKDLEYWVTYFLEDEDERKKVAEAGYEHLCKFHTNKARAQFFLEKVEDAIK